MNNFKRVRKILKIPGTTVAHNLALSASTISKMEGLHYISNRTEIEKDAAKYYITKIDAKIEILNKQIENINRDKAVLKDFKKKWQ